MFATTQGQKRTQTPLNPILRPRPHLVYGRLIFLSVAIWYKNPQDAPSTDFFVELHLALISPFRLEFTDPVHLHSKFFLVCCPLLPRSFKSICASGIQNCSPPSSSTLSRRSFSRTAHSIGSTGSMATGLTFSGSRELESM